MNKPPTPNEVLTVMSQLAANHKGTLQEHQLLQSCLDVIRQRFLMAEAREESQLGQTAPTN